MAVYGNAQWVADYRNENFYLDHKVVKEKHVNRKEIRKSASDFVRRMSGVAESYSADDIIDNPLSESAQKIQKGMLASHIGDVVIKVMPGWGIVENEGTPRKTVKNVRSSVISAPAYIMHPSVKAQKITIPVDATLLAPTVSRLLRIRSPNAAYGKPYILE